MRWDASSVRAELVAMIGSTSNAKKEGAFVRGTTVSLIVLVALVPVFLNSCIDVERYSTCENCGSTRVIKGYPWGRETILYRSPTFRGCQHRWRWGVSAAAKPPVSDGTIILLKKGATFGACIIENQSMRPERVQYRWYFRSDGKGTFRNADAAAFHTGEGEAERITFGPFDLGWSGHAPGSGYVYYSFFPGKHVEPSDQKMCITDVTDIEDIDATDSKWVYRASPSDPEDNGGHP